MAVVKRKNLKGLFSTLKKLLVLEKKQKEMRLTSMSEGHRHVWVVGKRYTSTDFRHRHAVSKNKKTALSSKNGGHSHKILEKPLR